MYTGYCLIFGYLYNNIILWYKLNFSCRCYNRCCINHSSKQSYRPNVCRFSIPSTQVLSNITYGSNGQEGWHLEAFRISRIRTSTGKKWSINKSFNTQRGDRLHTFKERLFYIWIFSRYFRSSSQQYTLAFLDWFSRHLSFTAWKKK